MFQILPLILIILVITVLEPLLSALNMVTSTSSYSALTSPSSFTDASSLILSSSESNLLFAFSFLIYDFFMYYTMHISFST